MSQSWVSCGQEVGIEESESEVGREICLKQLQLVEVAEDLVQLGQISSSMAIPPPLRGLFQCGTTLKVKASSLTVNHCPMLHLVSGCPSTVPAEKSLALFALPSHEVVEGCSKICPDHFFLKAGRTQPFPPLLVQPLIVLATLSCPCPGLPVSVS